MIMDMLLGAMRDTAKIFRDQIMDSWIFYGIYYGIIITGEVESNTRFKMRCIFYADYSAMRLLNDFCFHVRTDQTEDRAHVSCSAGSDCCPDVWPDQY